MSLTVAPGEIVALLGPSGCGKTTLLRILTGAEQPDSGRVTHTSGLSVGYLRQADDFARGTTVRGVITGGRPDHIWAAEPATRAVVENLLSGVDLDAEVSALSGGERRRVEIARCLAAEPKYLLLDEPFAGVDPISVGDIRGLVSDLSNRGIGVLITDHNVRETLEIVDRAYILHDGTVLMSGTPEEVVENENVRRVYLGDQFRIS